MWKDIHDISLYERSKIKNSTIFCRNGRQTEYIFMYIYISNTTKTQKNKSDQLQEKRVGTERGGQGYKGEENLFALFLMLES